MLTNSVNIYFIYILFFQRIYNKHNLTTMATGGIFQLITNDGKQDRMLMASALLKTRIDAARNVRRQRGDADDTPTLYDIERPHILFTNAH